MPHCAAKASHPDAGADAASRPLLILIGGAGDGTLRKVGQVVDWLRARPDAARREVRYFFHWQKGAVLDLVAAQPPGRPIRLIGHSWGGNAAARVCRSARAARPPGGPAGHHRPGHPRHRPGLPRPGEGRRPALDQCPGRRRRGVRLFRPGGGDRRRLWRGTTRPSPTSIWCCRIRMPPSPPCCRAGCPTGRACWTWSSPPPDRAPPLPPPPGSPHIDGKPGRLRTMLGLMQDRPLLISSVLEHAARNHGGAKIVSARPDGSLVRHTWPQVAARAAQLAHALAARGVQPRRAHRHAGLERAPAPGDLLRRLLDGRRAAHGEPAALPRPDRLHPEGRRRHPSVRRPDPAGGRRGAGGPAAGQPAHHRRHGDRGRDPGRLPAARPLRGDRPGEPARRPAGTLRLAGAGRALGLLALLYLRHHGRSEGRAVQPPLHRHPRRWRCCRRTSSTSAPRMWCCRSCRCST